MQLIKKGNHIRLFLIISFIWGIQSSCLAQTISVEKTAVSESNPSTPSIKTTKTAKYLISEDIIALVEHTTTSSDKTERLVAKYQENFANYNYGEQYLILLAEAMVEQKKLQHQQVINLLEKAKVLAENIVPKQLDEPIFADLYRVLTASLIANNNFEKAYESQKKYIASLYHYSADKRAQTVELLTKKYEIAHKNEVNELLDADNKLKALQLANLEKHQSNQQRNFILILCGILGFILLFFRQLKLRKKLLKLSKTDSLTGLYNRASLFLQGQKLVKEANDHNTQFSLILFDIDHFKAINDDYGHLTGDLVLVEIARLVSETMRSRDVFCRLGGEEFVALLPGTDIDNAKAIGMRIHEKIATHHFVNFGITKTITLSLGVVNIKDTTAVFEDMLHAADLAMYHAKEQGRNQMVNYALLAKDHERRVN